MEDVIVLRSSFLTREANELFSISALEKPSTSRTMLFTNVIKPVLSVINKRL
jgi:hypothetical protein